MSFPKQQMIGGPPWPGGGWPGQGWMSPAARRLRLALHLLLAGGIAGAAGSVVGSVMRGIHGYDMLSGGVLLIENLVLAAATILTVCLWWRAVGALSEISAAIESPPPAAARAGAAAVPIGEPAQVRTAEALPVRPFMPEAAWAFRPLRSLATATLVLYLVHALTLLGRSVYYFRYYNWSMSLAELFRGFGWATWAAASGFFLYAVAGAIAQMAESAWAARSR